MIHSIGKQWYQLPEFIPFNPNSNLHSSIRISIYTHLDNKTYPTPDLHSHQYLHLCVLYWLLDSHSLYKQMTSSLCVHATIYTTTFPVYPLLTTSTLYWIIINATTTDTTWPSYSLLCYLLLFCTNHNQLTLDGRILGLYILCDISHIRWITHTHTHTQPFYCWSGICPGPPGSAGTRKVKPRTLKPIWIYWSKR